MLAMSLHACFLSQAIAVLHRLCAADEHNTCACRKISLLIHPDRCKHPQARDAFEVLGAAQEELMNEETRALLMRVLEYARDAVREERRRATKHDTAVRIAASLHPDGRDGVEREWEEKEDFHEKWKTKSRDVLARAEFRRRKLGKRCAAVLPVSSPHGRVELVCSQQVDCHSRAFLLGL